MKLFGASESVIKAEETLQALEARLAGLALQRETKLADETADLESILRIDHEAAEIRAKVLLQRDRIEALRVKERQRDHEARLAAKAGEIGRLKKLTATRDEKAKKADIAYRVFEQAILDLRAADDALFDGWSDNMPRAHLFGYLRSNHHEALSTVRKDRKTPGVIAYLLERGPFEFGPEAEKLGAELITELEAAPLPEHHDEEAA